eukprot:SAG31_NODE_9576_length_1256_cov_2.801210_1_plen_95_part_00
MKVDGGPGKTDLLDLIELRELGVIIFPIYPNGSGYNQEMDVIYSALKPAMYDKCAEIEARTGGVLEKQDIGEILNGKIGDLVKRWPVCSRAQRT